MSLAERVQEAWNTEAPAGLMGPHGERPGGASRPQG